jgi:hypothetical protein
MVAPKRFEGFSVTADQVDSPLFEKWNGMEDGHKGLWSILSFELCVQNSLEDISIRHSRYRAGYEIGEERAWGKFICFDLI